MFLNQEIIREYHPNGKLMYECLFNVVEPMFKDLFVNTRTDDKGVIRIRVGEQRKFWDNGQLNWQMNYDENGNLISQRLPQYRKDGTVIDF